MFVAVITSPENALSSRREDGDYSCFFNLGETKEEAIQAAIEAKRKWDHFNINQGRHIKYRIMVGELTVEAIPSAEYKVVPIG